MARSNNPLTDDEIWGTWEEMLLACAVNRHGPRCWDAIATEFRSRSPYAHLLTAENCKKRFRLLKRRFSGGDEDTDEEPAAEIPWLDELRKLRVAELRQEVERHDVSIGSLLSKVKRLKEERERSFRTAEAGDGANGSVSDGQKERIRSPSSSPGNLAGDRISGEYSGRSCKESNSTEPKPAEAKVEDRIKDESDQAVNGSRSGSRSDPIAGTEASYNGSSDTIAKGAVCSPAGEAKPAVNESGESVAESKGGDEGAETKESSDVQSSASLSRRRRGMRRSSASAAAFSDAEAVDVESQPLMAFLEIIRWNKDGSIFDRWQESQESVRFGSLIRRHVDLEMVRNRIGRKGYTSSEFFRDLLLLCNNALVFYPKDSPESISAVHLRDLVNKEIADKLGITPQPSSQSAKEPPPPPPPPLPVPPAKQPPAISLNPKSDPDPLPPLVACCKQSSITLKPAKPVKKVEKEEQAETDDEEKEKEKVADKKSTKQRTSVSRKSRTSKGGGNSNRVPTPKPDLIEQESKTASAKKRGAANFLNRMKSSSPSSSNTKIAETTKSSTKGRGDEKQPKKQKEKESSKKQSAAAAAAVAAKRNVGRLPKSGAVMPTGKRAREEKALPVSKKRGRR